MSEDVRGQIEPLVESGEDGGGWLGYWCKGHHDPGVFAYACNYDYGHDEHDRRYVRPEHVRQTWWRTVPIAGEPGYYRFMDAEEGARGAFKVTVADISAWNRERQMREGRQWETQGRRSGINDALRFCAERFGADFVDLVQAWNATRPPETAAPPRGQPLPKPQEPRR